MGKSDYYEDGILMEIHRQIGHRLKDTNICGVNQQQVCAGLPVMAHLEKQHYTEPIPIACPHCGSLDIMKYGTRNGIQNYICRDCERKFNAKDAPLHMRTPTEQIGASLNMYYDGLSFADISRKPLNKPSKTYN